MVTVSAGARPAKPDCGRRRSNASAPRHRRQTLLHARAVSPVARVMMQFSRDHLAAFIEVAIDLLDLADDDPAFQLPSASIGTCCGGSGDSARNDHSNERKSETGDTMMDTINIPATGAIAQHPAHLLLKLAERNALIDRIDTLDLSELEAAEESAQLSRQDAAILATPAVSRDDMFAKLLLLVQSVTEGVVLEEADAAAAVREAHALMGAGRVSPNVCNQARG